MKPYSLNYPILFFTFTYIAYPIFAFFLVKSYHFSENPFTFATAIAIDLMVILPLLFYFAVLKKRQLNSGYLVGIIAIAYLIYTSIVPLTYQFSLKTILVLLPIFELGILVFLILRIKKCIHAFSRLSKTSTDFVSNLEYSLEAVFPNQPLLKNVLVSEITMLYFGLSFGFSKPENTEGMPFSTVHKKEGYGIILCVLMMVGLIETTALHVWVGKYSVMGSYILTGLSIYSFIFIIADYIAMVKRPMIIENKILKFRVGLRWRVDIPLSDIQAFTPINKFEKDKKKLNAALIGNPKYLLILDKPVTVKGIYGLTQTVNQLAFNLDDDKFLSEVQNL